jgi:glycosyltransferase involved in cell wall biosynthesis
MESTLREAVAKEAGSIVFEGHCDGERLSRLYRDAAFVVVSSEWYENAPMAVLESFAYGKPVIGTRIGGIPELITEGKHGQLVDCGAPEQLQAAIRKLWSDTRAQERMGRNARALIETKFAEEARTDALLRIYETVCSSRSNRAPDRAGALAGLAAR